MTIKKPITICVINLKGGVGKTTITALLSRYAFGTHKKDVLAIDLDPQANLSQGLLHQAYTSFLSEKRGYFLMGKYRNQFKDPCNFNIFQLYRLFSG